HPRPRLSRPHRDQARPCVDVVPQRVSLGTRGGRPRGLVRRIGFHARARPRLQLACPARAIERTRVPMLSRPNASVLGASGQRTSAPRARRPAVRSALMTRAIALAVAVMSACGSEGGGGGTNLPTVLGTDERPADL